MCNVASGTNELIDRLFSVGPVRRHLVDSEVPLVQPVQFRRIWSVESLGLRARGTPKDGLPAVSCQSQRSQLVFAISHHVTDALPNRQGQLVNITKSGTDIYNAEGVWETTKTQVRNLFSRQAIGMRWDFAEASALARQAGDYQTTFNTMVRVVEKLSHLATGGQVLQADATDHPLPNESGHVWFTDPPYYFAVPYADLSDFFFVWLKSALPDHPLLHGPFDRESPLTPKGRELCEMAHWDSKRYPHKDQQFFEDGMDAAFAEGRRIPARGRDRLGRVRTQDY